MKAQAPVIGGLHSTVYRKQWTCNANIANSTSAIQVKRKPFLLDRKGFLFQARGAVFQFNTPYLHPHLIKNPVFQF